MEWKKWCKEDLPEVNQMVLLVYESGYHGAIEFFKSECSREMHIKGMKWYEDHPEGLQSLDPLIDCMEKMSCGDPITHWMPFPELPARFVDE